MNCSIISDTVKVILEQSDKNSKPAQGSALQSPDVSRARLHAMLRRSMGESSARRRKTQWAAFIAGYKDQQPANSNV